MKLKIIIPILLILFLVTSCVTVEVADETPEEVEEETPEEVEEEEEELVPSVDEEEILVEEEEEVIIGDDLPENQYKISLGETDIIEGMTISISEIGSSAEVILSIDGVESKLKETKAKEIYNDYYFSTQEYNYKGDSDETYVIIEVTPLILEEDQYLIRRSETINVLEKDITLDDSKSDGYIVLTVCDEGTRFCEDLESIAKGKTEEVRGINIQPIEHYYRVYQYAILEITSL